MNVNIGRLAFVILSSLVVVASACVAVSGLADMLDMPGKKATVAVTQDVQWSFGRTLPLAIPHTPPVRNKRVSLYPLRVSGSPPDAGPDR